MERDCLPADSRETDYVLVGKTKFSRKWLNLRAQIDSLEEELDTSAEAGVPADCLARMREKRDELIIELNRTKAVID